MLLINTQFLWLIDQALQTERRIRRIFLNQVAQQAERRRRRQAAAAPSGVGPADRVACLLHNSNAASRTVQLRVPRVERRQACKQGGRRSRSDSFTIASTERQPG